MVPHRIEAIERRARLAYEAGRLWRAALAAAPILVLAACAGQVGGRTSGALSLGVAVYLVGSLFLWRGQDAGRAVLPGILAGVVPLSFALGARALGHVCTGEVCVSLCVPACASGGVLAGLMITWFARRTSAEARSWVCAGSLALLTGALGCSCAGFGGILGLVGGLAVTGAPIAARRLLVSR